MKTRPARLASVLLALFPAACSAPSAPASASPTAASASQARVPVAAAEGAFADAERLWADVGWLADDAREGRRAGTAGADDSARWIAARLFALGLEPAGEPGEDGGWMQTLSVPLPVADGRGSRLEAAGARFEGAERVVPLFCSDGARASGPLAFAGYGIVHAERGWDDYAPLRDSGALEGAVVLVARGTPPSAGRPAGDAAGDTALVTSGDGWGNAGSIFTKVMTAKRLGASAVLVAPHPDRAGEPLLAFDTTRSAQASIPALFVSAEVARALVPGYDERVRALDAGRGGGGERLESEVAVEADVRRAKGMTSNVLGLLRGRRSDRIVVVGAHYDHLGRGGDGSLAPDLQGEVHNGADDNASGTAAVLEIARLLAQGPPPGCDVLFALWSGEELGLLGSEHWAQHPTVPLERVLANLNLDMVGRAEGGALTVLGAGTAEPFAGWIEAAARRAGLEPRVSPSGRGVGGSDHQSFLKRRIPALHFFTGVHADYHRPSDDLERFEADGTRRIADMAATLVRSIASEGELAYVEPPAEEREGEKLGAGWRVWFGSVPEYSFEGPGVLLSATSAGSPAEKAGLLAGDVLLQVGEVEVETIYDFMHALQTYKPGDVVLTRYLRDGEEQEVRVTLATRDVQ